MAEKTGTKICKHCKSEIPAGAKVCPNCRKKQGGKLKWIIIGLVVLFLMVGACSGSDDVDYGDEKSSSAVTSSESAVNNSGDEGATDGVALKALKATYTGPTAAGTVIDSDSDIEVVAVFEDDTEEVVSDWTIAKSKTLKAGKTSNVTIEYANATCALKVKCTTLTKKQYMNKCKSISYKKLARNPDKYEGKKVKFTGKILQAQEDGDNCVFRIEVTKGSYGIWDDPVFVVFENKTGKRFLEDDIVSFYGVSTGIYTYTSILGASVSIPSVAAKYMVLR